MPGSGLLPQFGDDPGRLVAAFDALDVIEGVAESFEAVFPGWPGEMGGQDDVFQGEEWVAGFWRLFFEDIESGGPDGAVGEGCVQGGFVDDGAAAGVDEDGGGFHQRQLRGADHVPGAGQQWHVEAYDVRGFQHFVQQADLRRIDLGFELLHAEVVGDRFLLRDLVDNLIDNAIRYTPVDGTVTVRCRREIERCILVVEDNGPGIAAAHREAVFNRFYRIDDKTAGSGLGLAIVRDIVADHGARVSIGTGPDGSGTHFVVEFHPAANGPTSGSTA